MTEIAKKCLLIGINYVKTRMKLNGCINDSNNIKDFLIKNNYYKKEDIIMMNDYTKGNLYPTKKNMEKQLLNLVEFANKNIGKEVHIFISYSGHGYHVPDKDGDELDGLDEVLCPVDCQTKGVIVDDWIKKEIINKFHEKTKIVALIDACFSGTSFDLKYNYKCDENNNCLIEPKQNLTNSDIIMISGCMDTQESADAYLFDKTSWKYKYQGAMTASFLENYKKDTNYYDLLNNMRNWLKEKGFQQIPQLSSGKIIDTKSSFFLNIF